MNKYHNIRTVVDGIEFASKKEATHYRVLKLMENGLVISNLRMQVSYPLTVNGQKVCTYVADFLYTDENGKEIIVDVKGVKTGVYKIKKKLMKACLGLEIMEV